MRSTEQSVEYEKGMSKHLPRNSFRASVGNEFNGGKALNGLGGDKLTEPYVGIKIVCAIRQVGISIVIDVKGRIL